MSRKSIANKATSNPSLGNSKAQEVVDDVNESEEVITYKYDIASYGADYPVDGLVKRLNSGDILIPTFDPQTKGKNEIQGFQRRFIWPPTQSERFIESLLLGLPVPGIFLVKQADGKLLVLDGQQRLRTLQDFYKGIMRGKEFKLENVQDKYKHKTYQTLDPEDRRRLDDSIIHSTIVRQEQPTNDQSSIYLIFERLNTGGSKLYPQEIRVALYRGSFVELLRELNDWPSWRTLYGKKSDRLKDQELILRFFAMFYSAQSYRRPMKEFLNIFMAQENDLLGESRKQFSLIFRSACDAILLAIGKNAFRLRKVVNAAVLDSVLVGVAHRLSSKGGKLNSDKVLQHYDELLKNTDYLRVVERATADEDSVETRMNLSREAFSKA